MEEILGYKISNSKYPHMKIIETPKFIFRPANINDIPDFYEYLSQEKAVKYLPFKAHKNINDTKKFMYSFFINNYKSGKIGNYAIFYKPDKKVIGNIGLNNVSPRSLECELGICINPKYWGNGFSTEVTIVSLITAFELANLRKVAAITYSSNKYTLSSLKNLGFKYVKTYKPRSNLPMCHRFELTRNDYYKLKKDVLPELISKFNKYQ